LLNWLFGRRKAPPPARLRDLEERLDDVDNALAWIRKNVKDLNARLSTVTRQVRRDETLPDDPGATNGDDQPQLPPYQRPTGPTAHLAQRFRGF
jgi:hypothetical protein